MESANNPAIKESEDQSVMQQDSTAAVLHMTEFGNCPEKTKVGSFYLTQLSKL